MNSCWNIGSRRVGAWLGCAVLLASLLLCPIGRAGPEASGNQLRLVIILTRHGVRSPLETTEALAQYAAQPWPKWDVAPGIQTPHGNKLIALLGDYYRARFAKDHLLSGDAASDGPLVFAVLERLLSPRELIAVGRAGVERERHEDLCAKVVRLCQPLP